MEICTQRDEEELNTRVEISIGSLTDDKAVKTQSLPGRYPQWKETGYKEVVLQKEVAFQTDMKITLYNLVVKKGGIFKKDKNDEILGEFCIVVNSLKTFCDQPQYYNVCNLDGQFIGQILANFYIEHFEKKNDSKQAKNPVDEKTYIIMEKFKKTMFTKVPEDPVHKFRV